MSQRLPRGSGESIFVARHSDVSIGRERGKGQIRKIPDKSGEKITQSPSRTVTRDRKRGHYERGLFTGGISRISKISKFSRTSREWSDSAVFSRVWGLSRIFTKFSRISNKWDFSEKTPFPEDPFSRTRVNSLLQEVKSEGDRLSKTLQRTLPEAPAILFLRLTYLGAISGTF